MGLPIFREPVPTVESHARSKESRAINGHPRTSIRRRDPPIWASRTVRSPPPHSRPRNEGTPPVPRRRRQAYDRTGHPLPRDRPRTRTGEPTSRLPNGEPPLLGGEIIPNFSPMPEDRSTNENEAAVSAAAAGITLTASPQPMLNTNRINVDDIAPTPPLSPSHNRDLESLPPLRRMGNRSINDAPSGSSPANADENRSSNRMNGHTTETHANGLGDRERSFSPDENQWQTMLSTITPDPSLPSAESSFASAAVSSFNHANDHTNNHMPSSFHSAAPRPQDADRRMQRHHELEAMEAELSAMEARLNRPSPSPRSIYAANQRSVGLAGWAMHPNEVTREAAREFSRTIAGESGGFDYAPDARRHSTVDRDNRRTEYAFRENTPPPARRAATRADNVVSFLGLHPAPASDSARSAHDSGSDQHMSDSSDNGASDSWPSFSDSDSDSAATTTPPTSTSTHRPTNTSTTSARFAHLQTAHLCPVEISLLLRRSDALQRVSTALEMPAWFLSGSLREHARPRPDLAISRMRAVLRDIQRNVDRFDTVCDGEEAAQVEAERRELARLARLRGSAGHGSGVVSVRVSESESERRLRQWGAEEVRRETENESVNRNRFRVMRSMMEAAEAREAGRTGAAVEMR